MSITPKELVERFYFEVWNRADENVAREILHPHFRFRGSLGPERRGPEGFIDYMRSIHAALGGFTCAIDDLIVTEYRAAARMIFKGLHRGRFFEVEPTGREIQWAAGAFFTTDARQITELWVLGDVDSVKRQLSASGSASIRHLSQPHAHHPLLPADSQGDAEGCGDRLASADAARRHDPAGGGPGFTLGCRWV